MNKDIQSQYYGVHSSAPNMQINNATNKELWKNENLLRLCSHLICFNLKAMIAPCSFILQVLIPESITNNTV